MPTVYSTATADIKFTFHDIHRNTDRAVDVVKKAEILIRGGANIPNDRGFGEKVAYDQERHAIHIPRSVATKVTDEEADMLETNAGFRKGVEAGFFTLIRAAQNTDAEARSAIIGMQPHDSASPLSTQELTQAVKTSKDDGDRPGGAMPKLQPEAGMPNDVLL